jgi:regulator of protease activity HflC (stomatin/prohibitin superfamily)
MRTPRDGGEGPGLFVIIPIVDRMVRLNLQIVTMDIPPQDVITRDNVTVRVNAVTYLTWSITSTPSEGRIHLSQGESQIG